MNGSRKVGVEIEFAGIDAPGAAQILAQVLGGEVEVESPYRARVTGSRLGEIKLELDTRYAKAAEDPGLIDRALEALGARETAADMLAHVAPVELITEPLGSSELALLDEGIAALREAGLEGTKEATLNAFGMHLNIELDPPDPARAIRIAAAYAFAEHWLRVIEPPDNARRATPFIDSYPSGYLRALAHQLEGGGVPAIEDFIVLYARWNPDRNRGLDLWPLLGYLAPEAAERVRGRPVKNARPAFHYRLPDCRLGDPAWSPRDALTRWDQLEAAASEVDSLEALRRASLDYEEWRTSRETYLELAAGVLG